MAFLEGHHNGDKSLWAEDFAPDLGCHLPFSSRAWKKIWATWLETACWQLLFCPTWGLSCRITGMRLSHTSGSSRLFAAYPLSRGF